MIRNCIKNIISASLRNSLRTVDVLSLAPAAWYDATDAGTVTHTEGVVSAWNDKSGNTKHLSQATPDSQPSYANNTISFDGVADYLTRTESLMYSASNTVTVFVVMRSSAALSAYVLAERRDSAFQPSYAPLRTTSSSTTTNQHEIKNDANESTFANSSSSSFYSSSNFKVLSLVDTRTNITTRANGVLNLSVDYTRPAVPITLDRFAIGASARATGSGFAQIEVKEVIIFQRALTDSERSLLSVHLMNKHEIS